MTAAVAFSDDARRMLDDADERWVADHFSEHARPRVARCGPTSMRDHRWDAACNSARTASHATSTVELELKLTVEAAWVPLVTSSVSRRAAERLQRYDPLNEEG
jgi:hypothetical protein